MTKRDRQSVRFLNWITKYYGWWYLICTPGDAHMNPNMMKMLIERLAKEKFYEMILVLLMVHRNEDFMKDVFKYILLDSMTAVWKSRERKKIIKDILELLT